MDKSFYLCTKIREDMKNIKPLTENQTQVILTGIFGDGHITTPAREGQSSCYRTSCKFEEYLDYKNLLLMGICGDIVKVEKNGYSQTPIYTLATPKHPEIWSFKTDSVENNLNKLTDLGLALWFYDDGSLHKHNLFYNLNTHAFSEEVHQDLFVPYFEKMGYSTPKILKDRKKDGREFSYLYFNKHEGGQKVNKLLRQFPVDCYKYKLWPDDFDKAWDEVKESTNGLSSVKFTKEVKKLVLQNKELNKA